jgi:hypothetical protein
MENENAKEAADKLNSIIQNLSSAQEKLKKNKPIAKDLKKVKEEFVELERIIPEAPTAMNIEKFFETVGEGVIAAQKLLDQKSSDYLKNRPTTVPPSVFRIPKASAEFQFAIESIEKESFNVLIFGSSDERQRSQQHKIAFDIIAAPPPPDLMTDPGKKTDADIESATGESSECLSDIFVTDPNERSKIEQAVTKIFRDPNVKVENGGHLKKFMDNFPRVIIFNNENYWILLSPGISPSLIPEKPPTPALFTAYLSHDQKKAACAMLRAKKSDSTASKMFIEMLMALAKRQSELLQ